LSDDALSANEKQLRAYLAEELAAHPVWRVE
jgi:hypothetical protein